MNDDIEALLQQDRDLVRAKINSETAKIPWQDLQRFFAQGKVILVDPDLDLVDVAFSVQQDEINQVEAWAQSGSLKPLGDELARDWFEQEAIIWAVVVKPWVLVQAPT